MRKKVISLGIVFILLFTLLSLSACRSIKSRFFADGNTQPYHVPVSSLVNYLCDTLIPQEISDMNTCSVNGVMNSPYLAEGEIPFSFSHLDGVLQGKLQFDEFDLDVSLSRDNIYLNGLLDKTVNIPIAEFILLDLQDVYSEAEKAMESFFYKVYSDINIQETTAETVTIATDGNNVAGEKISIKIDKDNAIELIDSLFSFIKNSSALKELLQQVIFANKNIQAGSFEQYLDNILYIYKEYGVEISWSRILYKNKILEDNFILNTAIPEYGRNIIYKCYHKNEQQLLIKDINKNTNLAEISYYADSEENTIDFVYGDFKGTINGRKDNSSLSYASNISVLDTDWNVDVLYTMPNDSMYSIKATISNDSSNFKAEVVAQVEQLVNVTEHENSFSNDCYVLSNDVAGAETYDLIVNKLNGLLPGLKDIGLEQIGIEYLQASNENVMINGKPYSDVIYKYIAQQNRDYYSELAAMNWPEHTFEQALQETITTGQKLGDYIKDLTRQSYLLIYCIDHEFDRLSLNLTIPQLIDVAYKLKQNYPDDVMQHYCSSLNISEKVFRGIYASCYYKQNIIFDYYWGPAGLNRLNIEDVKSEYANNYTGIQYVVKYIVGYNGQPLSADEQSKLQSLLQDCFQQIESGTLVIQDAIKEYSDDYTSESLINQYESDYQDQIRALNDLLLKGCIIDRNGYFDSSASSFLPPEVVSKVFDMNIGEKAYLETDIGYWIIQKTDISDRFYEKAYTVLSKLENSKTSLMCDDWVKQLEVSINHNLIEQYSPERLLSMNVS